MHSMVLFGYTMLPYAQYGTVRLYDVTICAGGVREARKYSGQYVAPPLSGVNHTKHAISPSVPVNLSVPVALAAPVPTWTAARMCTMQGIDNCNGLIAQSGLSQA